MLTERKSFSQDEGPCLYVCSTPIGNLQDCSFRLLDTLRSVDIIAAEDTRQVRKLLTRYDIHPDKLVSYHEHNRISRRSDLADWWSEGKSIALVSDAGTPGVSDPGLDAVECAVEAGIPVVPIPGPSAVLAALVASGLPVQPFAFLGFLPRQEREAVRLLREFSAVPATLVLYEAPHRLLQTMRLLVREFPLRQVSLCKELTKLHETVMTGNTAEVLRHLEDHPPKGEYVIVLAPGEGLAEREVEPTACTLEEAVSEVAKLMERGQSHADSVRQVAEQRGVRRKELYQRTLELFH